MLCRDFNATTSVIEATVTAFTSTGWTGGAWVYPDSTGENNAAAVFSVRSGTQLRQQIRCVNNPNSFWAEQALATTNATCSSATNSLITSQWQLIIGKYDDSAKQVRLYWGDIDTPMAEMSYQAGPTTGSGAMSGTNTNWRLGNQATASTWDGMIAEVFLHNSVWATEKMERYRLGFRDMLAEGTNVIYWPLTELASTDVCRSRYSPIISSSTISNMNSNRESGGGIIWNRKGL